MSGTGSRALVTARRFPPAIGVVLAWGVFDWVIHSGVMFDTSPASNPILYPWISAFEVAEMFALFRFVMWGPVLVGLGFLARLVARARLRSGSSDPLDRLRAWTSKHPAWSRVLAAAPSAIWLRQVWHSLWSYGSHGHFGAAQFAPAVAFFAVLMYLAVRSGVRSLLAPTLEGAKQVASDSLTDEITFDAVAVTRETIGAVGAMMAMNVAVIAWLASPHAASSDWPVMGAFTALAVGGAALFRRASRVAIGVDGVHVSGSSRTRFFAYRDLDAARVNKGDLELVRGDRVLVRLQLHGEDALKRDAVLARIRDAIDRVKEGRGATSAQMVSSATADELARAASGAADYRGAALTREQLWALVEGPEVEASARQAAAEALSKTSDADDRARLRVAAEHCAAPAVRVALGKLADGEWLDDDAHAPAPQARRTA